MTKLNYFKPENALTFEFVADNKQKFMKVLQDSDLMSIHCDLSEVESCDSAGMALLIGMRRLCSQSDKELSIHPIPQPVRALAKLYGVEAIVYES